jgi:hypothetical protein
MHAGIDFYLIDILTITEMLKRKKKHYKTNASKFIVYLNILKRFLKI